MASHSLRQERFTHSPGFPSSQSEAITPAPRRLAIVPDIGTDGDTHTSSRQVADVDLVVREIVGMVFLHTEPKSFDLLLLSGIFSVLPALESSLAPNF